MADVTVLARLLNGALRNVDLTTNTPVVQSIKVGGVTNTELTKIILDNLIALQNGSDFSSGTNAHTHDGRYFTETELGSVANGASGASLIGIDVTPAFVNFTPTANNVQGALEGIDSALGSIGGFATTALDNLASTAVNADINPDTNLSRSLGSSSLAWTNVWARYFQYNGGGKIDLQSTVKLIPQSASPYVDLNSVSGTNVKIRFWDSTNTNSVLMSAPGSITSPVYFTLPDSQGNNGDVLAEDGSGNLSWVNRTYTADGDGIEVSGNQFSLELDGSTLSKSASGVKVATGGITNTEVNASAAIAESKLALDYSTSSLNTAIGNKVSKSGDTMSGDLAMGGNKVTGLGAPTANGDALRYDQLGANNGIATLDAGGKIPASQLPNSVMEYLGTWAASTNTPTLTNGSGNAGDVYVASDAGTVDFGAGNITFAAGDWVVYSGSIWEKSVNSNAVASVNGQTGVVTVNAINQLTGDVTAGPASGSQSQAATIAAGAVTGSKIASNTITDTNINASAAISLSKLAALTINRALVSDGSGVISASSVTDTELGYLSGVSSAIQTQLNAKALDADVIKKNGSVAFTADQSMGGFKLTNLGTPTASTDAVTKSYADGLIQSPAIMADVHWVLTSGDIASAPSSFGSYSPSVGDAILTTGSSPASLNGVYIWNGTGNAMTRHTRLSSASHFKKGVMVTVNADKTTGNSGFLPGQTWMCHTDVVTLGTDSITFRVAAFNKDNVPNLLPFSNGSASLGSNSRPFGYMRANYFEGYNTGGAFYGGLLEYPKSLTAVSGLTQVSTNLGALLVTLNDAGIVSSNNAVANSTATYNVVLATGNKTAGTGNSGDIILKTGTSSGGARGKVILNGSAVEAQSNILPDTDNTKNIGSSSLRFADIYAEYLKGNSSNIAIDLTNRTLNNTVGTALMNFNGANIDALSHRILNVVDPLNNQDAATKAYVDNLLDGRKWKQSVKAATTANITLSGPQTIDGISVVASDRVLVKDQTTASENGIYIVAPTSWSRASDADTAAELQGAAVFVEQGTVNADKQFAQTADSITLGVSSITWVVTSANSFSGDDMITLSGGSLSVDLAAVSGLESTNPGNAAGQLRVKLEASNPSLRITGSNELAAKLDAAGAISSGASGLATQVDASSIEISSNQLRVKSTAFDQDTIVGGSGVAASAQGIKKSMVAGESMAADTSFLVRFAMNGETATRVYKADKDASVSDKFYAVGIALKTSAVSAGDSTTVTTHGTHTLGASDTSFSSSDIGKPVFLTATGAFSVTAPTGTNEAVYRIGVVESTSKIFVQGIQLLGIN